MSQIYKLLLPRVQSPLANEQRASLMANRTRAIAGLLGVLTPAWILIDLLVFEWPLWGNLAGLRLVTSVIFGMIFLASGDTRDIRWARALLWLLLANSLLLFVISNYLLGSHPLLTTNHAVLPGYLFLPFLMLAAIALFPITALEAVLYALPILLAASSLAVISPQVSDLVAASWPTLLWLMLLLTLIIIPAAMSQLDLLGQIVRYASQDGLTQSYNRRAGTEMLRLAFERSLQEESPLTLAFVDLDNFREINETYGHEEGDNSLLKAAASIRSALRATDMVVRWGGEEFLVMMPNTELQNGVIPMQRLLARGLGDRPDETPLTASIGMAERSIDQLTDFRSLIDLADQRMFLAKQRGKARVVSEGTQALTVDSTKFQQPEFIQHA